MKKSQVIFVSILLLLAFGLGSYAYAISTRSDTTQKNSYNYSFSELVNYVNNIENYLESKTVNTTKYIIDKSLKWRVRDMLDQMNINERIAYPGLDGLTMWIKRHYYVK